MNRIRSAVVGGVLGIVCALGVAPVASAGQPGDYAYRWPLKAEGDSAAWQFALTPEVYAALADAGLRDFEVFNAEGQPVPVARLTVDPAATPGVAQVSLPAYALPRAADATATPDDLALRIERDDEGRLRVLQVETGADPAQLAIDYILDADMRRDPKRPSSVDRLDFSWPERGDVRARFVLEGSDDLVYWQTVVPEVAVVSLRRGDAVLQRRDVEFPPSALRYLRLRQIDGTPVPGLQVSARRTRAGAVAPAWQRETARFVDAAPDPFGSGQVYRYRLPAKLPVGRIGITLGADNATARVMVDAQRGTATEQPGDAQGWVPVGQTLLFRLRQDGMRIDNQPLLLSVPHAAREWRLRSPVALSPAPLLEVFYQPDRFVFLAQGPGPYTLAAGSVVARRDDLPVEQALAPLRQHLGAQWAPPLAVLGARAESAGQQAYVVPEPPVDWRRWLLWALLVGGAAAVGGFALVLMRQRAGSDDHAADASETIRTAAAPRPVARFDAGPPEQGQYAPPDRAPVPPEPRMPIVRMTDLDLAGKRVLIRQDLNVPVSDGKVTSDQRIVASLPTLKLALEKGAAVMVMSHLGRPKEGVWSEADSLAPVAARLGELLGRDVPLVKDWVDGVEVAPGQLVLLENCRMNVGEGKDDEALSQKYAALCDVFVMDAFGTAHRAQASTHGVIKFAAQAAGGPLLMAELDALAKALEHPARPLLAIVAGSKVSTKLELLSSLVSKVDQLIVGGGIANTFSAAMGHGVGKSLVETDLIDTAKQIMADAKARGADIPVPTDVVVAPAFAADAPATVKAVDAVEADDMILDIGPDTAARYAELIKAAGTVVWNGPVGVFEFDAFGKGTETLARAIAASNAFSIAGGGDTLAAVDKYGIEDEVSYISTGGGAFLEFLEGKTLPAVAALAARSG